MDTKELSLYVVDEIKHLINDSSNEKTLELLAKTYVTLVGESSMCQKPESQHTYDPVYISALGICALLSKKEFQIKDECHT